MDLTAKRIEEKKEREMDPVRLSWRVDRLQEKLEKQTRDYYQELQVYRHQFRKAHTNQFSKDLKNFFEVRLFDECD